uniref:Uncharacterized protein n=1 Tax=Anguilla anguilla TaxID=7936 RepID=A0A0E9UP13_ANGAN
MLTSRVSLVHFLKLSSFTPLLWIPDVRLHAGAVW